MKKLLALVMVLFLPLTALAYMVLSMSQNAAMIAIGAGMIGFCDAICSTAGATRVVNDWFHRHRGTVLGAVSAFTGVGGSLICILLTDVMDGSGWRGAYRCCGILPRAFSSRTTWLTVSDRLRSCLSPQ